MTVKISNRQGWIAGIAIAVILLLTLISAPSNRTTDGSTYSRSPEGYGAWYAYMQDQKRPITRWQKSPQDFVAQTKTGQTLIRSHGEWVSIMDSQVEQFYDWVERGNRLILLGWRGAASKANFTSRQPSNFGLVKVETTRRQRLDEQPEFTKVLSDRHGSIVWKETIGKGDIIYVTTPFLAANAYQDEPGNFAFLADLAGQKRDRIWVDEYLHGYRDPETQTSEAKGDLVGYLLNTPLLVGGIQVAVLMLVLIYGQNRRFGAAKSVEPPKIDNSEAYIQALAGVLQKAGSTEFITDVVGKAEQTELQRELGLGGMGVSHEDLLKAWEEQLGESSTPLQEVIRPQARGRRLSEGELTDWLRKLEWLKKIVKRDR
ncbi:MAG: DUF4350 domain-containing protein [Synechococcales bacterium]|nr:DUF4350 domain-containing protein [Synechococcales bacterium]